MITILANLTRNNDVITGTAADEFIQVPSSNANLVAEDIIDGGAGEDTLIFARTSSLGVAYARLDGLNRIEVFDVSAATSALLSFNDGVIAQSDTNSITITFDNDPLQLDLRDVTPGQTDSILLAGSGPVSLYDGLDQTVSMVNGFNGNILGGSNIDSLFGANGDDTLSGGTGDDVLSGDSGADTLDGGADNDRLYGGAGSDALDGGTGHDVLNGGAGTNVATGGGDADAFIVTAGETLTITDFDISDVYERIDLRAFSGLSFEDLTVSSNGGNARITLPGGTSITLNGVAASALEETHFVFDGDPIVLIAEGLSIKHDFRFTSEVDTFTGTAADEIFEAVGQLSNLDEPDTFDGGAGIDTLRIFGVDRSYSPTRLAGMDGIEIIDMTGATGDLIFVVDAAMVAGSDTGVITIKHGTNSLFLDTELVLDATHVVVEGTGQVSLRDVPGQTMSISDLISGDVLGGNDGNLILGGAKDDRIRGLEGDDILDGRGGNDLLIGGENNDHLTGGTGDDTLSGGTGDDVLISQDGNDDLSGGDGSDSFIIKQAADLTILRDYESANYAERIDLTDLNNLSDIGDLNISDQGGYARVTGSNLNLHLVGVDAASLDASDFVFAGQDPLVFNVAAGTSTAQLQELFDKAPAGAVINLEAGTYSVTDTLRIDRSDISVIGAGEGQTIFTTDISDDAESKNTILVHPDDLLIRLGDIAVDAQKGSNTVTLTGDHGLEVGDLLYVSQANDAEWLSQTGNDEWNEPEVPENKEEDNYLREMRSEIVSIDGNTVTLAEPLPYTFEAGIAQAQQSTFLSNVTLSGFTIQGRWGTPDANLFENTLESWTSIAAIELDGVRDSNISDINIIDPASHAFRFQRAYDVTGDNLTADGAHNKDGSNGYHFQIFESFANTLTNLTSIDARHAVLFSSYSAEHYNNIHMTYANRDINFHGSPDADNTIVVDRLVQEYPELVFPQWAAVQPGTLYLHPASTIEDNDVTFRYAETSDRGDTVTAHEDGAYISTGYGNDVIIGGVGNDTLDGGQNGDTLTGGDGRDEFIRAYDDFSDIITDFETGADGDTMVLVGSAYASFDEVVLTQAGSGTVLDFGPGGRTIFRKTQASDFIAENFRFESGDASGQLVDARATQLTLVGTDRADTIHISRNHLESSDFVAQGGAGKDTVKLNVSSVFGDLGDTGDYRGIDVFDMSGLSTIGITVSDALVGQTDTNNLTLQLGNEGTAMLNVEALSSGRSVWVDGAREVTLFGDTDHVVRATNRVGTNLTGEEFSDTFYGGNKGDVLNGEAGNDVLWGFEGGDTLDGGAGADYLNGGLGGDTYFIDNVGDQVIESRRWDGVDHVYSSIDFVTGRAHIEEITLTGSDNIRAIGNGLANTIIGNAGNNILDGKKQIDTMIGGDGDDLYVVSAPGEILIENADEGIDTVRAYRSWKLADNIENLQLKSVFDFNGVGNALDNVIVGNHGDNKIFGREGNDTLRGLNGEDTFIFDTAASADNTDQIVDFSHADDTIMIKGNLYGGLVRGTLDANAFHLGQEAADANHRVIYDRDSGQVWIDADGTGDGEAVLLATLLNNASIDATDFDIF